MAEMVLLPIRALVEAHREEIKAIVARHNGRGVAIFGSVARGDETTSSDVDFLVDFDRGSSLFDVMHVEDDLVELLGRRIDVISLGALKPRDDEIRRDAIWL